MKAKERKFVEFHEIIGDLKHLRRIGWVMREVPYHQQFFCFG